MRFSPLTSREPWPPARRRGPGRALLLSLLAHALLLSLTFGGDGTGLPGLGFPWHKRRVEVPDLHVVLRPAPAPPDAPPAGDGEPAPDDPSPAEPAPPGDATATARPPLIAVDRPADTTWAVPPTPPASAPVVVTFQKDAHPMAPLRDAGDSVRAVTASERTVDLAGLDRPVQDAQQQIQRLEAARLEAERLELARQEAAKQEAARREAARIEAARLEVERQEAERQAAARAEAARVEAARQEAARAAEEQREARLRAIGQQLNEEAARRDAATRSSQASPSSPLPTSWSSPRRGRLLGRTDTNAELVLYAEAWARKIQLNPTFELVRDTLKAPFTDPLVNVAIRSDGSVESVAFVRSSGSPTLDDAIRRVIQSQERYPAFPPALLQDYDVIEIRRTWHFDTSIRLY